MRRIKIIRLVLYRVNNLKADSNPGYIKKINMILEKIEFIKSEAQSDSLNISDEKSLESYRLKYISRNGMLTDLFEEFKTVEKELKGRVGKSLNDLKHILKTIYNEKKTYKILTGKN